MVKDHDGQPVPELARRITICPSTRDPAAALAAILQQMHAADIALGDVLADSAFSSHQASTRARPPRAWPDPKTEQTRLRGAVVGFLWGS